MSTLYADTVSTLTTVPRTAACCHSHPAVQQVRKPEPGWVRFMRRINHLLPCKATWMAIKDDKIIAWHDGPHWVITQYLKQTHTKADFCGLVQRSGCAPAGGPWCTVHREEKMG